MTTALLCPVNDISRFQILLENIKILHSYINLIWCRYAISLTNEHFTNFPVLTCVYSDRLQYSEIPLLRPPKINDIFYLLKTLFAKFKLFFSSFSTHSVPLIRDHLWDCPKVVFKTTFGQSQRWS